MTSSSPAFPMHLADIVHEVIDIGELLVHGVAEHTAIKHVHILLLEVATLKQCCAC